MRTTSLRGGGAAVPHHRIRATAGMFTAEFAVGLLAVVPLLLALTMCKHCMSLHLLQSTKLIPKV